MGFYGGISFVAIGSELLKGLNRDSNGPWLGKFLLEKGYGLSFQNICPDNEGAVLQALKGCARTSRAVILSGGLGPTRDDMTREIVARYCGVSLVESPEALLMARTHYERGGREFCPKASGYHLIPEGFKPVANPLGMAPGLFGEKDGVFIALLPGVPREFQAMFADEVFPLLCNSLPSTPRELFSIKTWGVSESQIFQDNPSLWNDLSELGPLSCLPHSLGVDLGLDLCGNEQQREKQKARVLNLISKSTLKDRVWQVGSLSLVEYVLKKLAQQSASLGFCESCTGGLAAHSFTNIAGCSDVFWGSVVCYSNDVKRSLLGVSPKTLESHGAVSEPVALEMASGGQKALGVDYCLAYSGIAGPGGGCGKKPVGTVVISLASPQGVSARTFEFQGDRLQLKEKFFFRGLFWLLEELF